MTVDIPAGYGHMVLTGIDQEDYTSSLTGRAFIINEKQSGQSI